jgi:hypothetical protein
MSSNSNEDDNQMNLTIRRQRSDRRRTGRGNGRNNNYKSDFLRTLVNQIFSSYAGRFIIDEIGHKFK